VIDYGRQPCNFHDWTEGELLMKRAAIPITYGSELAKHFRIPSAQSILIETTNGTHVGVTRLVAAGGTPDPTIKITPEKGFTVSAHLIPSIPKKWGTWIDGKFYKVDHWRAGGIAIYDLESDPRALRNSAFDSVHFNVPRRTIDFFAEDLSLPSISTLTCSQGTFDHVLYHLALLILPALEPSAPRPSALFLDHFVMMLCGHLITTYGSVSPARTFYQGGLAAWQKRRVLDLLGQHLDGDLRLFKLAEECGLSVSHFARSFKKSFGTTVHRYLILKRVEKAKELLTDSVMPLSMIALQSGFSDQAAFSRTFGAIIGTSPAMGLNQARRKAATSEDMEDQLLFA
jgi:AraC family transcriptional regulator